MPIVSTEVVEKDGYFVGLFGPHIATVVSGTDVQPRDMVVVTDLLIPLVLGINGFVAEVASPREVECLLLILCNNHPRLVPQELDGILGELAHSLQEVIHTVFTDFGLELSIELWDDADDLPPD